MERMVYRLVDGADHYMGTAEEFMTWATAGQLPKRVLVSLLSIAARQPYLDACAGIEKQYTERCTATNDPCLESGCAVEGEICLQPLLRADVDYQKACGAEWIQLFADPHNRVEDWKN
jgi:hypothetical protein